MPRASTYVPLAAALLEPLAPFQSQVLTELAEQAVRSGIDYASLQQGWDHPQARVHYQNGEGNSFHHPSSIARQSQSRARLEQLATALAAASEDESRQLLIGAFCTEIGAPENLAHNATWEGVRAALRAELLLPMRSLLEGVTSMTRTFNGGAVPRPAIQKTVDEIVAAVLAGRFSQWRYENGVGRAQLAGLDAEQVALWRQPTSMQWGPTLRTHEDDVGELGFFWATKIGGPSHGFDVEGQCLLPLLANARHKVILVSDKAWRHHPAGRAHFRMLWFHGASPPKAVLWLETVNCDFEAGRFVKPQSWQQPVLRHALGKASAMGVALSVETHLQGALKEAASASAVGGRVDVSTERLVLRPSNGVLEASDYLTNKHDWVQTEEEITNALRRAVWSPAADVGHGHVADEL